ncbi:hypothetical protein L6452_02985 [Arctium lappa]|uniref:Uncharacterized protein n=1 Tax=Arctium lappa TaxID=4217 RepID=A0ACB9FLF8_ARCLA|nr:hypothetical protein L6452_02985 [Arctium lappa]
MFYDKSVDSPTSFYVKSLGKYSKKEHMVWRVKSSSDDEQKNEKTSTSTSNAKKNRAHKGKSFSKPDTIYSANHLIRLAEKKICCSYCGANDFPCQLLLLPHQPLVSFLKKKCFNFFGDAAYLLSGLHSEDLDIEKEGKLPHLRTSFMHIESV